MDVAGNDWPAADSGVVLLFGIASATLRDRDDPVGDTTFKKCCPLKLAFNHAGWT